MRTLWSELDFWERTTLRASLVVAALTAQLFYTHTGIPLLLIAMVINGLLLMVNIIRQLLAVLDRNREIKRLERQNKLFDAILAGETSICDLPGEEQENLKIRLASRIISRGR